MARTTSSRKGVQAASRRKAAASAPKRSKGNSDRGRGHPTKLTPETAERILHALRVGNYITPAVTAAGVHQQTFRDWMLWGREGKQPYKDFSDDVARAIAECEANLVEVIHMRAGNDYHAALALLARRHPDRWADFKRQIEVAGEGVKRGASRDVPIINICIEHPEAVALIQELSKLTVAGNSGDDGEVVVSPDVGLG